MRPQARLNERRFEMDAFNYLRWMIDTFSGNSQVVGWMDDLRAMIFNIFFVVDGGSEFDDMMDDLCDGSMI